MNFSRQRDDFKFPTVVLLAALIFAVSTAPAATNTVGKFSSADCLDCHTDPANKRMVNGHSAPLALFPTNGFKKSVHSALDCIDCHDGIKELVHDKNVPPPNCAGCHEKEEKVYAGSIHGLSHKLGTSGAAQCWDCHGGHEILPAKNPASLVYKLNLPATCAKCHSNAKLSQEYQIKVPDAAAQYRDSIHGNALLKMGLIVAPSCNDCHGAHGIKRSVDRDSPINHANIAKTCGKCHVGIEETYNQSIGANQVSFYPLMSAPTVAQRMAGSTGLPDRRRRRLFYETIVARLQPEFAPSSAWCFSQRGQVGDEYIVEADYYVGVGSGAFSYLNGTVYATTFALDTYEQRIAQGLTGIVSRSRLSPGDQMRYSLLVKMFGLRLDREWARRQHGAQFFRRVWPELRTLEWLGAAQRDERGWRLTERGMYWLMLLMGAFFESVNQYRDAMRVQNAGDNK